jgi:hypothetical protein
MSSFCSNAPSKTRVAKNDFSPSLCPPLPPPMTLTVKLSFDIPSTHVFP